MKFMVIVKSTPETEKQGAVPDEQMMRDMGAYNEELVAAGVMLAGEGLLPSAKGARVRFSGTQRTVVDGPFAESKELVAGFWMWECRSLQEAIDWAKRCPNTGGGESELEIRQVASPEDFAASDPTGELREAEAALRLKTSERAGR